MLTTPEKWHSIKEQGAFYNERQMEYLLEMLSDIGSLVEVAG